MSGIYNDFIILIDPLFVILSFAGIWLTLSIFTLGHSKVAPFESIMQEGTKTKRRVLIVIAHPDDECMFFGPTILHFTQKEKASVYLLCLSSGDFYKKGKQRSIELWSSCHKLGIDPENVILYRCDDLPDDPLIMWPTIRTSQIIGYHSHTLDINMIITFDRWGISGHLNHCAIYNALKHLIEEEELPTNCGAYCLDSVNILRKYSSMFDLFLSYIFSSCAFTINCRQIVTIQEAMKLHASQYVWFRRLYIIFSRYVLVNTLTKVN